MPLTPSSAFKPCDVRGTYPDEVDERLFWAIGRAVTRLWPGAGPLLAGGDARLSTPSLLASLVAGLAHESTAVVQPFPTPGLYYVGAETGAMVTLIVTASHNPAGYNGLKLLLHGEAPDEADMARLEAATAAERPRGEPARAAPVVPAGVDGWAERYVRHLIGLAPAQRRLRVVVDPGNGCLCGIAARALWQAGHDVIEIHGSLDGRFPDRGPDPTAPGALAGLAEAVRSTRADLGAAFDGDGDRVVFVDAAGEVVPADATAALLARQALGGGGGAVVLDVRTSRLTAAWLRRAGAEVIWSRPGHAFVRSELRRRGAAFGGEISGHYFFAELGGDDGLYAALRLAALIGGEAPLAEMVAALPRPRALREVRLPYAGSPEPVLAAIEAQCRPVGSERFGNGLSLDLGGAWVVARLSLTEPLMAVRCEAESLERLAATVECVEEALVPFGLSLRQAAAVDPVWQCD